MRALLAVVVFPSAVPMSDNRRTGSPRGATVKPRVCVVVASEMTIRTLIRHHLAAMQEEYEVTVVVNTTNQLLLAELSLTAELVPIAIERGISIREDIQA